MSNERLRAQLNLINLSAAYKKCFLDPETGQLSKAGARVLRDLSHYCHVGKSTMKISPVTRQVDTHASMAAEGRRDVARRVWAYIELDPTTHPMMKDSNDE